MKPRILLIEDNGPIIKLVADFLRFAGYEVAASCNLSEILRLVDEDKPHLILMDLQLPETDGLSLTRLLKGRVQSSPPVILAFTASASQEDRDDAMAAGCDGFVSKPVSMSLLMKTIQGHLPGYREDPGNSGGVCWT